VLVTQLANFFQVLRKHGLDAAFALDGFKKHRGHIGIALRGFFQRVYVVDRDADEAFHHGPEAFFDLFVASCCQCGERAAVEGFVVDHDFGFFNAFVVTELACQFQRCFVGLQAAVAKEHIGHAREFHQFGRQGLLVGHVVIVAAVNHLANLVLQGWGELRVSVTQCIDGNTSQSI
jgi:hypothetical protein